MRDKTGPSDGESEMIPEDIACKAKSLNPLQILSTHMCNGTSLRQQDRNGRTPLALVSFLNSREKVALLLRWIASSGQPRDESAVDGSPLQARFTIVHRSTGISHEIEAEMMRME